MSQSKKKEARKIQRESGIPEKKDPVYNLKTSDIERIKKEAADEAIERAFLLMLGIPVMVLHDKFGFGKMRCERFSDYALDLFAAFNEGRVTFEDIETALKAESGIVAVREMASKRKR